MEVSHIILNGSVLLFPLMVTKLLQYSHLRLFAVRGGNIFSVEPLRQEGLDPGVGHLDEFHEAPPDKAHCQNHHERKDQKVQFQPGNLE